MGNKVYGGESSHLPLKINTAGSYSCHICISIIIITSHINKFWIFGIRNFCKHFLYVYSRPTTVYVALCVWNNFLFFFLYLYCFQPKRNCGKFKKVRRIHTGVFDPGERSAEYIETILNRLTNNRCNLFNLCLFVARIFNL